MIESDGTTSKTDRRLCWVHMTASYGMRKRRWVVAAVAVAALALFGVYELLFGRLFPFSPVVAGFSRQEYESFIVYHHGQPESSQLSYLSDVVAIEEDYHGMPFRSEPEIFLCRDDREYHRLTGGRARFIAINGRLFVSKRAQDDARQGRIDLRTYLTHEMSHCLLQQHMSILRSLKVPRWLLEGTAMDCAGQVGVGIYPDRSRVYDAVARGVFCEPADFGTVLDGEKGTALSCPIENRTAFFYSEFGCLVEFLRSSHGAQRYQAFLKDLVESRTLNVEKSFEEAYGTTLGDEIARFKNETQRR
ncbi:MAG: hypothetical protein GXY19_15525 [Phycisphaerae bacterium]|nr:hypothetical protein [Phycisphaerae bacterium]